MATTVKELWERYRARYDPATLPDPVLRLMRLAFYNGVKAATAFSLEHGRPPDDEIVAGILREIAAFLEGGPEAER